MLFHERGPEADTFRRLIQALRGHAVPHVFVGELALMAHGYKGWPTKFAVCVAPGDIERFRAEVDGRDFRCVPGKRRTLYDPLTDIAVELLPAGDFAGDRFRFPDIRLPGPAEAEERQGVPIVPLPRFIEMHLAAGRFADTARVILLIERNGLDAAFAARLHPSVRGPYHECYSKMLDEIATDP